MGDTGTNSLDEEISFLKESEIFSRLSTKELKIIMQRGRMETYSPGSVLFNIGDPADAVYVVKAGVVEVCRESGNSGKMAVVAYLGESDPIGEVAIITGSPRTSMARSMNHNLFIAFKLFVVSSTSHYPKSRCQYV